MQLFHSVVPTGCRQSCGASAEPNRPGRVVRAPPRLRLRQLLRRSPIMLPIPGTSSIEHLDENVAAAFCA